MSLSWIEIAFTTVTVIIGAVLQGSIGFGMGLFASPILILIDSRFVPGPILFSTMVLVSLLTFRERKAIDVYGLQWAVVGRVSGTVVAAVVLSLVPRESLVLFFGVLILVGVGMSVSGIRLVPTRVVLVVAGVLSGIMGTIASIGGPPMALVYQHSPGARLRSTVSGVFLFGTILSLIALTVTGHFGLYELRLACLMVPGLCIGFVLSRWTAGLIDVGYTKRAVLGVSGVAAVIVIGQQLF